MTEEELEKRLSQLEEDTVKIGNLLYKLVLGLHEPFARIHELTKALHEGMTDWPK